MTKKNLTPLKLNGCSITVIPKYNIPKFINLQHAHFEFFISGDCNPKKMKCSS